MDKINIAILSSGDGTNTENIIQYFINYLDTNVSCVISNKENSEVLKKIRRYRISNYYTTWYKEIDQILSHHNIHYIILDNWSENIPPNFCKKYQYKIINICPSLKYDNINRDIIYKMTKDNNDDETGISIHFVTEDKNITIFQKKIKIFNTDSLEDIKSKTQDLEQKFYPKIIENIIKGTYEYLFNQL